MKNGCFVDWSTKEVPPKIFRVSHDYLVEQKEVEEDLFTEIEPVRDSSIESFTLVTVECKCSVVVSSSTITLICRPAQKS